MGLLDGKNIVITGVLTDASLAFGVAKIAKERGRRHRAHRRRPGAQPHAAHRPQARPQRDGIDIPVFELDVTDPAHVDAVRDGGEPSTGAASTACSTRSASPRSRCLGDDFMGAHVGRRRRRHAHLDVLAEGARRRVRAADDRRRVVRRPRLRQLGDVAGLQLDGRRQVGAAEPQPLPRQRARPAGHPLQPRRRRSGADDGGQVHPGLRAVRGHLGRAGPARLGHQRPRAGGQGVRRPAVGLVPGDDRRDRPRRRRLPLHRCGRHRDTVAETVVASDRDTAS